MNILWFQHIEYEGLGQIESWAQERGHTLSRHAWFENPEPPSLDGMDALILMGGPMSVHDTDAYPWLEAEKELLLDALDSRMPVLGICLGAQLIAEALGAMVIENPHRELGWFPVHRLPECESDPFFSVFPEIFPAFHWHGETFTMLHKAIPLGNSDACTRQGFHSPPGRIGLQFHLELGEGEIKTLIENGHLPEWQGPYVQSTNQCLHQAHEHAATTRELLDALLDRWASCAPVRA